MVLKSHPIFLYLSTSCLGDMTSVLIAPNLYSIHVLMFNCLQAFLVAQTVKNLPAVQETLVRSLGWEDPLEKVPTPVFLPGDFRGQRSLVGSSAVHGTAELDTTEQLTLSSHFISN